MLRLTLTSSSVAHHLHHHHRIFLQTPSNFCSRRSVSALPKISSISSNHNAPQSTPLSRLAPLDGTLCDSNPFHYFAFRETLQKIGFNGGIPITEEFFIKNISGKHNEGICPVLFPDWDLQKGMKFMDDKEAMFRRTTGASKWSAQLCKWIEERGLKRAAVTNAPRENAELIVSILGIKAGVAAGMPVLGLISRNPEELLIGAGATFLIKDFEDPKLWAELEELDRLSAATAMSN